MFGKKIIPQKIKKKNINKLKLLGIDVIDNLPCIEIQPQRSAKDIATRCVILAALLQLHFGAPRDFIEKYITDYKLIGSLSPIEKKILQKGYENLNEQEKVNFFWTIEAIWALAWVGKKINSLSFNTSADDTLVSMFPNFQESESPKKFIDNFEIRSEKEIYIELDKFYRVHWFARNNKIIGKKSPQADLDIIMERRKALEWAANSNEEWDEISLDT